MLKLSVPKVESRLDVDTSKFPANVMSRLIEIGLTAHIRSAVNSAYATELEKSMKASEGPDREAFEAAEKASKEANAKYKMKSYKSKYDDKKAYKAFVEAFTTVVDPMKVANDRLSEMFEGKIRAARGESGSNKALSSLVKSNILAVLKAKGKAHRDALAMIGDDPFAFIDKTARKRAGDDADAYKTELAKLNAQYVDPARTLLADDEDGEEGAEGDTGEEADANDLI